MSVGKKNVQKAILRYVSKHRHVNNEKPCTKFASGITKQFPLWAEINEGFSTYSSNVTPHPQVSSCLPQVNL